MRFKVKGFDSNQSPNFSDGSLMYFRINNIDSPVEQN